MNWKSFCQFLSYLAVTAILPSQAQGVAASAATEFDGHWAVSLVCEDVQDKGVLVKGYTFTFFADIRDGKLAGQHGTPGKPAFLTLDAVIQQDGTADIVAKGLTAHPDFSVGQVHSGTNYTYRMRGHFTKRSGSAARIELRPCRATFSKR